MKLSAEEIKQNWENLIELISNQFQDERRENLLALYNSLADRISIAPASSVNHFHNAIPGGYVDHVLRVVDFTQKIYKLWSESGADMSGYTYDELIFVALNHDLGKIGFPGDGNEIYIPNDSEWHKKNQGKIYKINNKNPFTLVNDLSVWLLQHYDIKITWNEYLGIKLTDGLYDENNKPYYISRSADSKLYTNLPYIVHQADCMAARIEFENWKNTDIPAVKPKPKSISNISTSAGPDAKKLFTELFGD